MTYTKIRVQAVRTLSLFWIVEAVGHIAQQALLSRQNIVLTLNSAHQGLDVEDAQAQVFAINASQIISENLVAHTLRFFQKPFSSTG